ncbi:hypothetical protein QYZ87_04165 [Porphyromonadaceae bacterium W3.11]|nr:hypothetical protein [Porphyromonadaceae bacterium W3.11]
MKKVIIKYTWLPLLLILCSTSVEGLAQSIDVDIFGNLIYESIGREYTAKLEKNIFDDLIFSDNKGNEIILKKKYIKKKYGNIFDNQESKISLFRRMIKFHRGESDYRATYDIDIFDTMIIEDNRGRKVEMGRDIFGNETYDEVFNGKNYSMRRNLNGDLVYIVGDEEATLRKDIFDHWIYEDSLGNEFQFSKRTWARLIDRFGSEENIFDYLVYEFLLM